MFYTLASEMLRKHIYKHHKNTLDDQIDANPFAMTSEVTDQDWLVCQRCPTACRSASRPPRSDVFSKRKFHPISSANVPFALLLDFRMMKPNLIFTRRV